MPTQKNSNEGQAKVIVTGSSIRNNEVNGDDPIVLLFVQWWKQLVLAVVCLLGAIYIRTTFKEAAKASAEKSSEIFGRVHEDYERLTEAQSKLSDEKSSNEKNDEKLANVNTIKSRLLQQATVLGDGPKPYSEIARLYTAISGYETGASEDALKSLQELSSTDLKQSTSLIKELGMYVKAKILIDKEGTFNEGVDILKNLAKEGKYTSVIALISLSKILNADPELSTLVQLVKNNHPEQGDLINTEVKNSVR